MSSIERTDVTDYISKETVRAYEAMFLVTQGFASDLKACVAQIQEILDKGKVSVIAMKKWDERRLAYEIDKQKRGVFFLVYFRGSTENVATIERACNLSENIMRYLILSAEHLSDTEMTAADAREELRVEATLRAEQARSAPASTAVAADDDDDRGQDDDDSDD